MTGVAGARPDEREHRDVERPDQFVRALSNNPDAAARPTLTTAARLPPDRVDEQQSGVDLSSSG